MLCPICHQENADDFLFCQHCGKSLKPDRHSDSSEFVPSSHSLPAEAQYCVNCGEVVNHEHKFCSQCGTPYAAKETEEEKKRICAVCGAELFKDHLFCSNCGTPCNNNNDAEDDPDDPKLSHRHIQRVDFTRAPKDGSVKSCGFKLVHILDDDSEGNDIPLHDGENIIGSATANFLKSDRFISPKHLKITCLSDVAYVEDNNSLNGVFIRLNGGSLELMDGDVFRIGEVLLSYSHGDSTQSLISFDNDVLTDTTIMGNEESEGWGYLHIILGPYSEGNVYRLNKREVSLGRSQADIVFPDDAFISGTHASLTLAVNGAIITDLNSSNGTFVRLNKRYSVSDTAFFLIGNHLFRLSRNTD